MASQLYTSGPAHVYWGQLYLGTARVKPYIEIIPAWSRFYSDETGRVVPRDESFDMEHAVIVAELNRIDFAVYQLLTPQKYEGQGLPTYKGGYAGLKKAGSYTFDATGTMVIAEGFAQDLRIVFPYSPVTAFAGMPPGYRFPTTVFEGPDRFSDMGISDLALTLTWHALPSLGGTPGLQNWILYDNLASSFQGLAPPT